MKAEADSVFVIQGDILKTVPARPMRAGLFGKSLEDALQTLIEKYPEVIPGKMIEPGSDDPPRFVMLRREMAVGGWSLDHLLVDQRGVLTLVETKLIQNPDSRRDVIGQIMEYAANAVELWTADSIRQTASMYWKKRAQDLNEMLEGALGEGFDPDTFWVTVEDNLRKGNIRLIIAGDEIRPEVRRIIEYLNAEMTNAEVLGLELRCYGEESQGMILVPRLIGQTQASADRRSRARPARNWSDDELRQAYEEMEDRTIGSRLAMALDWATSRGLFMRTTSLNPAFSLIGRNGNRLFSLYSSGGMYCYIADAGSEEEPGAQDSLVQSLKEAGLMEMDLNPEEVVSGRNLSRKINELSDAEFEGLLTSMESLCSRTDT